MLYALCCTATRTRGIIFKTFEHRTTVDLTIAEDRAEAMERLRSEMEQLYGTKIGRGSWKLDLSVAEVPLIACIMAGIEGMAKARVEAEREAEANDTALPDGSQETTDGKEEPIEAGQQASGIDPQPEAEGSVRGAGC